MLTRLISLLSRIPAVKWVFKGLRPPPHSGSLDAAPGAADEQRAISAEAAPALDSIDIGPIAGEAGIELVAPVAEDNTAVSVLEQAAPAPTPHISGSEESSAETPAEIEPVVDAMAAASIETARAPVDVPDVVSSDVPTERLADADPEVANEIVASLPEAEARTDVKAVAISEQIVEDEPVSAISALIEPAAVDAACVIAVDTELPTPVLAEPRIDTAAAPSLATEIEPSVANELPTVAPVAAEDASAELAGVLTQVEPAPAPTPRVRAKIVEPADRAGLIRQRWAETGIRMWNPHLHGTGEATLNIQGRIGLLPPEPGETMPRYDKLEFKMLGGQIVCEGVILEAPLHASQRSFTRLAEPRGADRAREPVRDRQAALA